MGCGPSSINKTAPSLSPVIEPFIQLRWTDDGYICAAWEPTDTRLIYSIQVQCEKEEEEEVKKNTHKCIIEERPQVENEYKFKPPDPTLPYSVSVSCWYRQTKVLYCTVEAKMEVLEIFPSLYVDFSKSLRKGGFGVYEGSLKQGVATPEKVAVKLVQVGKEERMKREIDLSRSVHHLNLLLYKGSDRIRGTEKGFFIAMELCRRDTLHEMITEKKLPKDQIKTALLHLMLGLSHLHGTGIVHMDLHPRNIFFSGNGRYLKIGDFDHIKQMECNGSSVSMSVMPSYYRQDWAAPEIFKTKEFSFKSDVYSAGLLIVCVLSVPEPSLDFKYPLHFPRQVLNDRSFKSVEGHIEKCLIQDMLQDDPLDRPTAEEVLKHPFFWNAKKRFDYFAEMKTYFVPYCKKKKKNPQGLTKVVMDSLEKKFAYDDWLNMIETRLTNKQICETFVKKAKGRVNHHAQYMHNSIFDLIRFVRNLYTHFNDDPSLRRVLNTSEDFWQEVVEKAFPELLPQVYYAIKEHWPAISETKFFPSDMDIYFNDNPPYKVLNLPEEEGKNPKHDSVRSQAFLPL